MSRDKAFCGLAVLVQVRYHSVMRTRRKGMGREKGEKVGTKETIRRKKQKNQQDYFAIPSYSTGLVSTVSLSLPSLPFTHLLKRSDSTHMCAW